MVRYTVGVKKDRSIIRHLPRKELGLLLLRRGGTVQYTGTDNGC